MKSLVRISKLLIIGACFLGMQPTRAMLQNVLDYIQSKGKPAAQKTVDALLLTPRAALHSISDIISSPRDLLAPLFFATLLQSSAPLQGAPFYGPKALAMPVIGQLVAAGHMLDRTEPALEKSASLLTQAALGPSFVNTPYYEELLYDAIYKNNLGLIRSILAAGYDINRNQVQALFSAIESDKPEIVELFLKAGAQVNNIPGRSLTPLVAASDKTGLILPMLLAAGADVNGQTGTGETALMRAAQQGNVPNVKLLLSAGADALMEDDRHHNALWYTESRPMFAARISWQADTTAIQSLLRFHMAKQEIKPQVKHLLERKKAVEHVREAIEKHAQAAGTWGPKPGVQDVANIIKGYL